ncbi:serine hydrolase [Evansella sp. AB-P1]|uniref:serine hydrolase domain-containing protein n=1 Tax=Evansella sp. AB-P1 TaxID=3037653 RepID=UPI00241D62EA|nr:serine hydrolase [Evansella sp. AB-P1]MDG5788407.1 serine hydrolase [Evansella sp. AB-P1]
MVKNKLAFQRNINMLCKDRNFSGVVLVKRKQVLVMQSAYGYANRVDELQNNVSTRFGIASGCKIFTAIAICQLVEKGLLSFSSKLKDCLAIHFPHFHTDITVHHLLTHSSGVPDYFDESVMNDFADLWKENPMYLINNLQDFLPMFQDGKMMFDPGERFHYNNAGYILLGLIIEENSGMPFIKYVEENIFHPCGMKNSGYFSLDQLPRNTAYGYIDDEENGIWKTNVYSIPIKGGSDGGAFITVGDMGKLWDKLMSYKLLNKNMTELLLTPHVKVEDNEFYGYGIWISKRNGSIYKYHVMGYDPGVSFHSSFYPHNDVILVIPSNKESGPYELTKAIEKLL